MIIRGLLAILFAGPIFTWAQEIADCERALVPTVQMSRLERARAFNHLLNKEISHSPNKKPVEELVRRLFENDSDYSKKKMGKDIIKLVMRGLQGPTDLVLQNEAGEEKLLFSSQQLSQ